MGVSCADRKNINNIDEEEFFDKIKKIGSGSFGEVFLIISKKTKIKYAAKIIEIKYLTQNNLKLAYEEVKILKQCNHPNIIFFKEVFKERIYNKVTLNIITEYCDDGDLDMKVKRQINENKYFDENLLIYWMMQLALALKYIHKKKIIHRDIKPSNIFLTKSGIIKLGDFGLSKIFNNKDENNKSEKKEPLKKIQSIKGTPSFLSPEILAIRKYTEKADIWALGVTFYYLMNFAYPYKGKNLFELCGSIALDCKQKIIKLYTFSYSEELIKLVDSMMSRDPQDRPSAEMILKSKIIQERMNPFLRKNNFDKSLVSKKIKEYKIKNVIKNIENRKEKSIIEKNLISKEIKKVNLSEEDEINIQKQKEYWEEYEMNQLLKQINKNIN